MSCTHPILAVDYGPNPANPDKHLVKILLRLDQVTSIQAMRDKYEFPGVSKLLLVPCGHCAACRIKRRKEWSVRCSMESKYHKESCFVTLTYDDDHYPGKLVKSHFQGFIKALRNSGLKIRYFGCGEYGSKVKDAKGRGRAHYHIIVFGYFPPDVKYYGLTKSGYPQYTSAFLSKIWNKGFVTVSDFTPEVAGYTAGYCDKKFQFDQYFEDDDAPEFLLMSTKPGIGRQYVEEHLGKIYSRDSLIINFGSHHFGVPRYFDKVATQRNLYIEDIKELRNIYSSSFYEIKSHGFLSEEQLFEYKNNIFMNNFKRKVRSI